ncbi:photosystem II reaction center protein Psb28 [Prochlorococcus marinus]|uniref:Photosystem II reaction center Psb28 protein n=1 Tax=Prochlorococcus marinus XMU1408 TaxID=2213228 RepID=A0A318R4V6_PROMR|nr:photosystem II reaction center protein Psb28 [Prochlorococcus marinus]MBW3041732.1 photosystem II reaction center protein Psb28 [Prochlorococcus marinus str. XMU1408]PYE02878.1 photosystem II reaction center protein Psb28 [Prochlorococcus marinus XMU1408]
MTNINKKVAIQFIKGKDEEDQPEIRLFRNLDGKKGQAIYKFYKPSSITFENFNSIQKMYLIDEEGELSTRKIDLSISETHIREVKSTYNWKSEKEFERFMRFSERYSNSLTHLKNK